MFWTLTRFILHTRARFSDKKLTFDLADSPLPGVKSGTYRLISKQHENITGEFLYRLSHPLGEYVLHAGKTCDTPTACVCFDISGHAARIAVIERLRGKAGWLILQHLGVESFEREEYLLFSGFGDDGQALDQETCIKLFQCEGSVQALAAAEDATATRLAGEAERHARATISRSLEENSKHFNEAREQLEKWAEDMEVAAAKELEDTKNQIKAANRQARLAITMQEQATLQDQIRDLEQKKRRLRQRIFDIEDEITVKRDRLIEALERRMQQKTETQTLFTLRWTVA